MRVHVALLRIIKRERELRRALAAKPRIEERERIALEIRTVALTAQRQGLSVTLRDEACAFLATVEEVAHGEIGKLQTESSNDTRLSPTGRKFHLVAALRLQRIGDVHRSADRIGLDALTDAGLQGFRVELVHIGQLHHRTLDRLHREKVARLGAELAADDIFIHALISRDADVVERGLVVLSDAHFEVDGVAVDVHFNRVEVVEHISVVVIHVSDAIVVLVQTLVEKRLIVDIAFLHSEHVGQNGRVIDLVAHPVNISQVVFLSLINIEIDVDVGIVNGRHTVALDEGIAVAPGVHLADDMVFVFSIFLRHELLRSEDID